MIYLDTSAFMKLYLGENGSEEVHRLVVPQPDPLPPQRRGASRCSSTR